MNVQIIAAAAIALLGVTCGIIAFAKLPNATKIANVKEWLKWAVTEAEKALGSGTGQLKLRMVYDMAVKQFPWVVQIVPFATFASWVDESLTWMRLQLSENKAAQDYVEQK